MRFPRESTQRRSRLLSGLGLLTALMMLSCGFLFSSPGAQARSAATPWTSEMGFQNLVYGSSSTNDVVQVMGAPPDDILRSNSMFPPVENFFYYDEDKSGAATVFVFENGFLVGMHLKTPDNQLVDMTYFLINNGDRRLQNPMLGGVNPYFFNPRFYTTPW